MASVRRAQLERRRRVLREDLTEATPRQQNRGSREAGQAIAGQAYTDAARADHQPRVTDLIPLKPMILLIIFLFGLTVVTGIETLFVHRPSWTRWLTSADLASLDLAARGNLSSWFSSLLLFCAAAYAVLIFNIRRHKLDDYHGRYGLWIWAMFGCLIASIDCTTGLHQTVRGVMVAATGTPLVGDGSIWWIGSGACVFGVVATRVFLDMRGCPGACVAFGLAVNCYLMATTAHFGFVHLVDDVVTTMLHSTTLLLGHLMLLFSFLVYARHVFLDAQGQIASTQAEQATGATRRLRLFPFSGRESTPADSEDEEAGSKSSAQTKTRPTDVKSGGTREAAARKSVEARKSAETNTTQSKPERERRRQSSQQPEMRVRSPEDDESDDSQQEQDTAHLSKAERRRLRKLQRRQKRAA